MTTKRALSLKFSNMGSEGTGDTDGFARREPYHVTASRHRTVISRTGPQQHEPLELSTKLSPQQRVAVMFPKDRTGNVVVEAVAGCLHAETVVGVNRAGKSYQTTIANLVRSMNGNLGMAGRKFDPNIPTRLRAAMDGVVCLAEVESGVYSGRKLVYEITLSSGHRVRATADHRVWTNDGWRSLNGGLTDRGVTVAFDAGKGWGERGAKKNSYARIVGMDYHPFAHSSEPHMAAWVHRLVVEAEMNDMSYEDFVEAVRDGCVDNLTFLDPAEFHVHHVDGDHKNNALKNLRIMSVDAHLRHHATQDGGWRNVQSRIDYSPIKSVERLGISDTFDLTMRDQDHPNFIADGIVVHNSGKTFTITEATKMMEGEVAVTAYNKAISVELQAKMTNQPHVTVGTCHSFGLRALKGNYKYTRINAWDKAKKMMADIGADQKLYSAITKLVSIAKQTGVGIMWQAGDTRVWDDLIYRYDILLTVPGNGGYRSERELMDALTVYAINGLAFAQETAQTLIDFDDMIWIPLVEDMTMKPYDWVVVDEVQDINAARRELIARMMNPVTGRAFFVGDRHQAIYAFTGADSKGVETIIERFNAELLPLSVTFRCSKAATALARTFVPQIEAAPSNTQGKVEELRATEFEAMIGRRGIGGGDAILCRLTKPLVKLCLQLVGNGIAAYVEGRDIGKTLEALVNKWKVETLDALYKNLESYRASETKRLREMEAEYAIESMNDRIDAVLALSEGCTDVASLKVKIGWMFDDTELGESTRRVTLSTVHKAKGREWDRVFILGWDKYMPSRRAKQDWQIEAERNLQYVAVTRTRNELYLVDALD